MIAPVPDGALWNVLQDRAEEQLQIYGLTLGVDTDQIATLPTRLLRASEKVRVALDHARRGALAVEETTSHAPRSGARASWAAWQVVLGRGDLPDRITDLSSRVFTAIDHYRRQESELANRFYLRADVCPPILVRPGSCANPNAPWSSSLPGLNLLYLGQRIVGAGVASLVESFRDGRTTPSDAQTGYFLRESTSAVLDYLGVDRGKAPVHTFASLIVPILTGGVSARVRVQRVPPPVPTLNIGGKVMRRPGAGPSEGPTSTIEGIVRNVGALYPSEGAQPGTVRVDRVVGADGSVSWQVFVPGTQSAHAPWGGDVPNDWAANLQMYAGHDNAATSAVTAALRAAGVRPGEPVMVAGHSQGGLVAASLAADEQVRSEFDIASVVTIGSPVGHFDVPDGVAALHLEHTDDLVAGLDDQTNPIAPNRTTITRDVTAHLPEGEGPGSVVISHDIPAYVETATLADASTDPAVREWLAASAQMLDPHASVMSVYLRSERVH